MERLYVEHDNREIHEKALREACPKRFFRSVFDGRRQMLQLVRRIADGWAKNGYSAPSAPSAPSVPSGFNFSKSSETSAEIWGFPAFSRSKSGIASFSSRPL